MLLLVALVAAGCAHELSDRLQSGEVLALHGLQGRWAGPVTPLDSGCGQTTQGLLSIGKGGFGFDPFQSTSIIRGDISDDGRLAGSLARPGPEHQTVSMSFEARETGDDAIEGTLQSGRCHWKVALHRA